MQNRNLLDWQLEAIEGACQIPLKPLYNASLMELMRARQASNHSADCRLPCMFSIHHGDDPHHVLSPPPLKLIAWLSCFLLEYLCTLPQLLAYQRRRIQKSLTRRHSYDLVITLYYMLSGRKTTL